MLRSAFSIRHPAVALLALLLSLFAGQRGSADEQRAARDGARPAIAAPLATNSKSAAIPARKPWQTHGHPRQTTTKRGAHVAHKPWQTHGHPRKVAPTPREGSAHGPRAPAAVVFV